jgi:hypothetical protein
VRVTGLGAHFYGSLVVAVVMPVTSGVDEMLIESRARQSVNRVG